MFLNKLQELNQQISSRRADKPQRWLNGYIAGQRISANFVIYKLLNCRKYVD